MATPRLDRSDGATAMAPRSTPKNPRTRSSATATSPLGPPHTPAGRGLRAGEDIATVGYDDIEDARYAHRLIP